MSAGDFLHVDTIVLRTCTALTLRDQPRLAPGATLPRPGDTAPWTAFRHISGQSVRRNRAKPLQRQHALASLIAQARQLLPQAVHDARDQELTWTQIGELLNTTATTAARRYRNNP
jgi:hypothetical protein